MKYVMFERDIGDGLLQRIPVIFPNLLTHSLVAEAMLKMEDLLQARVVSAGELSSLDVDGTMHGHSESLGIGSDSSDTSVTRSHDYTHGI